MGKRTQFRFLIPMLVAFALVTGATQLFADTQESTLAAITQKGELILGTSANMAPMTYTREDGKVVGFDIDIARLMADGMGVKLNIKTMPFDQLLTALEKGEVDVVVSNITMNPKRNLRVAFVGPYLTSGKCVVSKREDLAATQEGRDINVPETRFAALKGSTSAEFVEVLFPKASLTLFEDHDAAVKAILADQVGGLLTDYPICLSILKRYPDANFASVFSLLTYEPIGIALPGSDPLYINWTDNFLKRLDGTGLLRELSLRWLGTESLDATE